MEINSATIVEILNMGMGVFIAIISLYAAKKFSLNVFRRAWIIISLSGAVMVIGSLLRSYYSQAILYEEWAWLGRIFIFLHLFFLAIGIHLLAMTAVKMWGD